MPDVVLPLHLNNPLLTIRCAYTGPRDGAHGNGSQFVDLIDIINVLRRRWLIVVLVVVACVGGAALATSRQTDRYRTSTRILVSGSSDVSAVDEITRRQLATQRAVAFAQIATTGPAVAAALTEGMKHVVARSGYPSVTASATGTDPFLVIVVTDSDPQRAAAVAAAYPVVLPRIIAKLEETPSIVPTTLSVLEPPAIPSSPYSPKPAQNGLIGLAFGLALGLGGAFVREALDRRLRDSDDVERAAGVSALGVVPEELSEALLPVLTHPLSARAEAYRKVRTNLTFTTPDGIPRSLMITSSTSGEGKTTLSANLALACARTGLRVALVDADLRRPMVAQYLGVDTGLGLTSYLLGMASVTDVLRPYRDSGVDVITSGPIPSNPSELLGSVRMGKLLDQLEAEYETVIIDVPPVLPVADGLVVGSLVRGVILVARVGDTTRDRLRRSKDAVLRVNQNLLGVVPNHVIQREDSAYAYAYRARSKGTDSLKLYTGQARLPEVDSYGHSVSPATASPADAPPADSTL